MHPCKTGHLEDLAPSRAVLYKILSGMRRRKEIRYEWFLRGETGRPACVLSNRNYGDCLRHELLGTDVFLALGYPCRRLDNVDPQLRPDGEIDVNGELHYVEIDTGSERGRKIEERLSLYENVGSPVLWVVMTEDRRRSLRVKDRNENSYFGLFGEVVRNPKGEIWLDVNNQFLSL